ncbi:hypothetical protein ACET3Z_005526 [Daucus carota]
MPEEEQDYSRPAESHRIVIPNEVATPRSSSRKQSLQRRCWLCCAFTSTLIFITGIVLLILFLTVFKVKKPTVSFTSLTIAGLEGVNLFNLGNSANLTVVVDVSVKNPNVASYKFKNGTTEMYYKKVQVADAHIPSGNAKARKTMHMNVTADFMLSNIASVDGLVSDLMNGSLPLQTSTSLKGKVNIINIVKKKVAVKVNCSLTFLIANQTLQDLKCKSDVDL